MSRKASLVELQVRSRLKADLGHSASAIDTTAPTNTGHPANGDAYGCSTAETGHSFSIPESMHE